jgi:hypothetical protein
MEFEGIVEFLKNFGLDGNGTRVATLLLGLFFFGLAEANSQELIPANWLPYITVAVNALAAAMAAMGYYEFGKRVLIVKPR